MPELRIILRYNSSPLSTPPHPSPQLTRPCQDLLSALVANTTGKDPDDVRVVEGLVTVRLRSKILANQYLTCVR